MKKLLVLAASCLMACGGTEGEPNPVPVAPPADEPGATADFAPVKDGYTRFAPSPLNIGAGEESIWCQWVAGPAEEDRDILDITGHQPFPGHHAVLFATPDAQPVGTSRLCVDADQTQMRILGGVGGEGSTGLFPTGAAVRLPKGQSLLINAHYLNTSNTPQTGKAVIDVKFAPPSADHILASFIANATRTFELSPHGTTTLDLRCVLPHEVRLIRWANHMHDLGTGTFTEVIQPGGGAARDLARDASWDPEWTFNPRFATWPISEPHVLPAGTTIHTQCTWNNTTSDAVKFPREMCIGLGYVLADKPMTCLDGAWQE